MLRKIISYILLLTLFSCTDKIEEEKKIIDNKHYIVCKYVNEKLFSEQGYILYEGKELKHGFYKEYHRNGVLAEQKSYLRGRLLGTQCNYNEEGKAVHVILSGLRDSSTFEMFLNDKGRIIKMRGCPIYVIKSQRDLRVNQLLQTDISTIVTNDLKPTLTIQYSAVGSNKHLEKVIKILHQTQTTTSVILSLRNQVSILILLSWNYLTQKAIYC